MKSKKIIRFIKKSKKGGRPPNPINALLTNIKSCIVNTVNNTILVVNYGLNRIDVFDMNHQHIGSFGNSQNPNQNLYHPRNIAIDPENGNVVVADSSNNRVQIYDINGVYIRTIDSFNGLGFMFPKDVAVASNGNIFVADHDANRVCCYNRNGDELGFANQYQVGPDTIHFNFPYAIAVGIIDGVERILVGDSHNSNVVIFELNGQVYNSFSTEDDIRTIVSLDVDNNGNVHCIQSEPVERIVIYNSVGVLQRIQTFNAPMPIIPRVIRIDHNTNNIYITDQMHNYIAIFDSNYVFLRFLPELDLDYKIFRKRTDLPHNIEDMDCAICTSLILERGTDAHNLNRNVGGYIVQLHINDDPMNPHLFHYNCIRTWFTSSGRSRSCPTCRRPFPFYEHFLNVVILPQDDGLDFFDPVQPGQNGGSLSKIKTRKSITKHIKQKKYVYKRSLRK
jgi:DNA-binding beta-propeller fold protein YncE